MTHLMPRPPGWRDDERGRVGRREPAAQELTYRPSASSPRVHVLVSFNFSFPLSDAEQEAGHSSSQLYLRLQEERC